jgi:beta-phosphoglucomutase family hydrolase
MNISLALSCRAFIFDMDGTMIDNMMVHYRAWQQKLKALGMDLSIEEVMRDIHGVNDEIIKRLFGDRFTEAEVKQIAWEKEAKYRDIYAENVALVPGLEVFLKRAKALGIPMGIGTAAPGENVDFIMDALNLHDYFSVVVHADHVKKGKPDPEVFEKVALGLDISIHDCVIFEDSPTGAKAAQNGDSQSIIFTSTHNQEDFEGIGAIAAFQPDFTSLSIKTTESAGVYNLGYTPEAALIR